MLTLYAHDRGTGLRRLLWDAAAGGLWLANCVADRLLPRVPLGGDRAICGARFVRRGGVSLAETGGDPAAMGAALGRLLRPQVRGLIRVMTMHPAISAARASGLVDRVAAGLALRHRAELDALADAAGVDRGALLAANVIVDACCSALVAGPDASGRPLALMRNMDFFPAGMLGAGTVLTLMRPQGRRSFLSIGWPGCGAVISGINDAGLCACILLNYDARRARPGVPMAWLARDALEECGDVAEAVAMLGRNAASSDHYLLLADERRACISWRDPAGILRRHELDAGFLACSNGARDLSSRQAVDDRGRRLRSLAASGCADPAWLRAAAAATYLRGINTQAMVFVPQRRVLQVAVGDARRPAALSDWHELELAGALAGGGIDAVTVRVLPRTAAPPTHFAGH